MPTKALGAGNSKNCKLLGKQIMASRKSTIDQDLIRDLAALLTETDLTEIEVEQDDLRIRVARNVTVAPVHVETSAPAKQVDLEVKSSPAPAQPSDPAKQPGAVSSPMVGTAYLAPEPGAPPYVSIGDSVTKGQTILIVEAMKTMNQIPSPRAGKVIAILVEDSQPVEYGEALMIIE
jgi:acetyl-CoA carboxylase biotin carboxyl carrier protein